MLEALVLPSQPMTVEEFKDYYSAVTEQGIPVLQINFEVNQKGYCPNFTSVTFLR